MCERRLEHRSEQRVVACYDRAKTLLAADRFCSSPHKSYIDKRVHRIGWRLDEDHRDAALGHDAFSRATHAALVETVHEALGLDSEAHQGLLNQHLGAAVERTAVQDRVAGLEIG